MQPHRPILTPVVCSARVGTVNCGLALMTTAWDSFEFAWEINTRRSLMNRLAPHRPPPPHGWDTLQWSPATLLKTEPVDILVTNHSDAGTSESFGKSGTEEPLWMRYVERAPKATRPTVVLEIWRDNTILQPHGGLNKAHRKRMHGLGFTQQVSRMSNTEEGAL